MKRLFKKVTAALLALTLVMSMSLTAMAAGDDDGATTEPKTTAVAITKQLNIAEGITTPAATFSFNFAAKTDLDGVEKTANDYPALSASIAYTAADKDVNADGKIVKATGNILENVTFPHAGVYAYTVTENGDAYTCLVDETMTYSEASYILKVYVVNGENGPVIDDIKVVIKNDDNEDVKVEAGVPGEEGGEEGGSTGEDTATESVGNDFRFVNTFDKKAGSDEDGDGKYESLTITNTAAGAYGNKEVAANYTLTLTVPASASDVAMSYSATGTEVEEITVAEGKATVTFSLKHGEKFVLYDAPAGTTYTVVQEGVEYHVTSAVIVENDGDAYSEPNVTAEAGAGLTVADKLIGEGTNSVDFTNTRDAESVTPTGIIINNFPYMLMVLIAALGICMIIVSKKRRA